jgi:hypothetical protein
LTQPPFSIADPRWAADRAEFNRRITEANVPPGRRVPAALAWASGNGFFVTPADIDDASARAYAATIARQLPPDVRDHIRGFS